MCRAKSADGTVTRCPSCFDKDKRKAYNQAYYISSKASLAYSDQVDGIEAEEPLMVRAVSLALEQVEELERLENMPDVATLSAYTRKMFANASDSWGTVIVTYDDDDLNPEMIAFDVPKKDALTMDTYHLTNQIAAGFKKDVTLSNKKVALCRTKVVTWDNEYIVINGTVVVEGEQIGNWTRKIFYENGNTPAYGNYDIFNIDTEFQGVKLGTKLISHFDSVMLAAGITRVKVVANTDVGGYAWAKSGYDWDPENMQETLSNITRHLSYENDQNHRGANTSITEMIQRLQGPQGPNYPSPYEIAMLGRDSSNSNESWVGKRVMLGSSWYGTRNLVKI
jgi:hypothetical protein